MGYTKGEWKYNNATGEIESILFGDNGFIKICDITPQDTPFRMEANAEHIVLCVNSHDKLVEALKSVLASVICNGDMTPSYAIDGVIRSQINKALSKAEGE